MICLFFNFFYQSCFEWSLCIELSKKLFPALVQSTSNVNWQVCKNPNGDRCKHLVFSQQCPHPGRCQGSLCGCTLQYWSFVSMLARISDCLCCESGPGARVWSHHHLQPPLLKSGSSDLLPAGGYHASGSPGLVPMVQFSASSPFGRPWYSVSCLPPKSKRKWKWYSINN